MPRTSKAWNLARVVGGLIVALATALTGFAEEQRRLSVYELADWIDKRLGAVRPVGQPLEIVDDATFLRRVFLDLNGTVPTVSQAREFLDYPGQVVARDPKRMQLIEQLLTGSRRPDRHAERTAAHWASLWRRMMVPGNSPQAQAAVMIEPWLKEQFAKNTPYDQIVKQLIAPAPAAAPMMMTRGMQPGGGGPETFLVAVGGTPSASASAVARVFLGERIGCAECHDHPFAPWKQKDFWGMAAFFSGVNAGSVADGASATIRPENSEVTYSAAFPGAGEYRPERGKGQREALADWVVSPSNPQFAATAVNRAWQALMGVGLTGAVDDLDLASAEERAILDELAGHFATSGFDLRWLLTGICLSEVYQQRCVANDQNLGEFPGQRHVKTLTPEQLFNTLEQALSLPIARIDGSARYNGLKDQLISRMNEGVSNQPVDFKAGIPQALLLINGPLTVSATDLETSRTLRGVLDAPFLTETERLDSLFLAVLSRRPTEAERGYLMSYAAEASNDAARQEAYSEIFWALLNSPEVVLEK